MNAVGIDISQGKNKYRHSPNTGRCGGLCLPAISPHTQSAINCLIKHIPNLDGETNVCLEHTGRYYESVATLFIIYILFPWRNHCINTHTVI